MLGKAEEVERFWIYAMPGMAQVTAELRAGRAIAGAAAAPRHPPPVRGGRLSVRWRSPPVSAPHPDRAAASSTTSRTIASTDEEATTYRVVLSGADLAAVRAGYDRLLARLDDA